MHGVQMGEGDAHPFACAPARIRLQGGQVAFFGAGRGRVVSPPRGVVPDRPPVPSVGGAVGTAARRPAPAGQLVIVIGELGAALRLFRAEDHSKDSQSFDDQHPYPCLDDLVHVQYVYDDSMYMYRYSMPYPYSS
jgi:hypothetical protein